MGNEMDNNYNWDNNRIDLDTNIPYNVVINVNEPRSLEINPDDYPYKWHVDTSKPYKVVVNGDYQEVEEVYEDEKDIKRDSLVNTSKLKREKLSEDINRNNNDKTDDKSITVLTWDNQIQKVTFDEEIDEQNGNNDINENNKLINKIQELIKELNNQNELWVIYKFENWKIKLYTNDLKKSAYITIFSDWKVNNTWLSNINKYLESKDPKSELLNWAKYRLKKWNK